MKQSVLFLLALLLMAGCKSNDDDDMDPTPDIGYEGYTLIWADEFNDAEISDLNWTYETGDGNDFGQLQQRQLAADAAIPGRQAAG